VPVARTQEPGPAAAVNKFLAMVESLPRRQPTGTTSSLNTETTVARPHPTDDPLYHQYEAAVAAEPAKVPQPEVRQPVDKVEPATWVPPLRREFFMGGYF
jgi:hypothetical protein